MLPKWYQNDNKMVTCYQKLYQSGNIFPKNGKN